MTIDPDGIPSYPSSPATRQVGTAEQQRLRLAAVVLLATLTAFRIWYAGSHELLEDESYYWQWSRHLDWGYYDNTPLAAFVICFFTHLLGATSLGVRAGAIASALTASVFIYSLGIRLFGERTAFIALLIANFLPLFAIGAITMTMDPVQLAFWSAALYVTHLAVTTPPDTARFRATGLRSDPTPALPLERGGRTGLWLLAGLLAGLAAMSKLNGLLLLPSILLYLLLSPDDRHWLRRPQPYLAALVALAVFAPFVYWNATHENAFWHHIGAMGSRSDAHDPPLKYFWRYIGDQALMLSPFFFVIYLASLWSVGRAARRSTSAMLFAWAPTATVFLATALVSLRSRVEANWPAAAYVTAVYLLAVVLESFWKTGDRRRRAWVVAGVGLALLMSVIVYFPQPIYAVVHPDRTAKAARSLAKVDRTNELYGWDQLAARIVHEQQAMGTNPFVFGTNYRMPSEAAFYLPGHPRTYSLFLNDRPSEYMFWGNPRDLVGRDAVYINDDDSLDNLDDLRAVFDRVEVQPPLLVLRPDAYGRHPIRTIQVVCCWYFRGYDVNHWRQGW